MFLEEQELAEVKKTKISSLKVSKSRKQILKFSFEPKTNKNIFVFLP